MNGIKICFHGHTHVPVVWALNAGERLSYGGSIIVMDTPRENRDEKVELDLEECLYLVNVGAVGQPRSDDRKPCYCIFDSDSATVEFHKVSYDAEKTKAKMRDFGLPESLIDRLGSPAPE